MIEETIKALNNEEAEALEVDSELDGVGEKIKELLVGPLSITKDESTILLAAFELDLVRVSRELANSSCNRIFVALSELEREEDTGQKLILIREITTMENTDVCSHGEGGGCKIVSWEKVMHACFKNRLFQIGKCKFSIFLQFF